MNPPAKKKSETKNAGDIRKERDPKPIASSEDVEEGHEVDKKKEGNLPPAMPPGA
jgi:hypothetical protein